MEKKMKRNDEKKNRMHEMTIAISFLSDARTYVYSFEPHRWQVQAATADAKGKTRRKHLHRILIIVLAHRVRKLITIHNYIIHYTFPSTQVNISCNRISQTSSSFQSQCCNATTLYAICNDINLAIGRYRKVMLAEQ